MWLWSTGNADTPRTLVREIKADVMQIQSNNQSELQLNVLETQVTRLQFLAIGEGVLEIIAGVSDLRANQRGEFARMICAG